MWVFLNNAFVSIVAHDTKPDVLLVRGRVKGDVERFMGEYMPPDAKVKRTPLADYLYRVEVSRYDVSAAIAQAAGDIDYPNFKDSVPDAARHVAYSSVWSIMYRYQHDAMR